MDKKQVKKSVTLGEIISWNPCGLYTPAHLSCLMAGRERVTPRDAVALYESGRISSSDCVWFLLHFLTHEQMHILACDIAQETIDEYSNRHPSLQSAIDVKRRWICGRATDEELRAALSSALWVTGLTMDWAMLIAGRTAVWVTGDMTVEITWAVPYVTKAIRESQIAMILAAIEDKPNTKKQTGEKEQK